ncbi:2-iminobutanoate/2-iminopropanoate deaminase [Paenibacillus sp. UNCCL117]|uniref:RidA family protein n=1 Tax=unclassified Paenibacillus TaxID=185978 RepID=UPI00088584CC|nr:MULTISPECIES: Rid family hydrolase [unclassified Paenibacillus]SDC96592.1 2-iminobutanoate/2-iminopropanoate deaminase [Paenibacillus sp. cl123]SFW30337.1 2-iminobutanoate/2-iminopropanoate deaminase [Paenibacillus sp. UNCCL117]
MKTEVVTPGSGNKPISSGIETESFVFVSGQGGLCPETGKIVGGDLESQTVQTLENIRSILAEAGLSLDDVVKVNVYLSDRKLYGEFNGIYERFFRRPYPSRTTVYCDLNYDLLVEIDAIAVKRIGVRT